MCAYNVGATPEWAGRRAFAMITARLLFIFCALGWGGATPAHALIFERPACVKGLFYRFLSEENQAAQTVAPLVARDFDSKVIAWMSEHIRGVGLIDSSDQRQLAKFFSDPYIYETLGKTRGKIKILRECDRLPIFIKVNKLFNPEHKTLGIYNQLTKNINVLDESSPASTLIHEYGHRIYGQVLKRGTPARVEMEKIYDRKLRFFKLTPQDIYRAAEEPEKEASLSVLRKVHQGFVSYGAALNADEMFAEALNWYWMDKTQLLKRDPASYYFVEQLLSGKFAGKF